MTAKKDRMSYESITLRVKAIGCVIMTAVFPEASDASGADQLGNKT